MLSRFREAARFDAADAVTRRALVRGRLEAMLRWCRDESPFYARYADAIDAVLAEPDNERFFAAYAGLPALTKQHMVDDFDALMTDRELSRARVEAFDAEHGDGLGILETARGAHQAIKTSGTSGTMVFVVDSVRCIKEVMSLLLFRALLRVLYQTGMWPVFLPFMRPLYRLARRLRRGAVEGAAPTPLPPSVGERLARFFRPSLLVFVHRGNRSVYRGTTSHSQPLWVRLLMHIRVLSHEETLNTILRRTQWQQPEFIFGLPSRIGWLARAQLRGELRIDPLAVYVGGETLHAELLDLYKRAWPRTVVINTYGATETKGMATACAECGELHVLEDIVHLELYDAQGGPVAAGDVADQVFCTGLWNRVTPVLRYAMTDRIEVLPDAGCRWRTQRIRVRGREPAFLWAPHQKTGEWVPLNGRMLKESLVALPDAIGFMVRYVSAGAISLQFVLETDDATGEVSQRLTKGARAALAALVREQGSDVAELFPNVSVEVFDMQGWNEAGGKLGAIVASVLPPHLETADNNHTPGAAP
jgi:phenylacetate-coenzyme A ligase PaaK-like adenylate-forming protein